MKDEEIKLPSIFKSFGNTSIDSRVMENIENYAREAVRLNQPQSEPIPFNLEAAKRGDPIVTRDGRDVRFIGVLENIAFGVAVHIKGHESIVSTNEEGRLCNNANRSDDLFMKPKPMRTVYVCAYKSGKLEIFDDANTAGQHGDQYGISVFSVQIPDVR